MKNTDWLKIGVIVVVGLGMTGVACARVLAALGAEVVVTDTRGDVSALSEALNNVGACGAKYLPMSAARDIKTRLVIVSPGLDPKHELVRRFSGAGAEIISEIELAWRLAQGRFIAVTGSNGKTTCTGFIGHLLNGAYQDVRVTGNIGAPLIEAVAGSTPDTVFVLEVSSFQLETCNTFRPDIGIILNVQDDHRERHATMQIYAEAKRRLIERQNENDVALLNADDQFVRGMAPHTRAGIYSLSTRGAVDRGGFFDGSILVVRLQSGDVPLGDAGRLLLKGEHNISNALAAGCAALLMDVPESHIRERLCTFEGYPHRIEHVACVAGVEYIDDSKGTNTDAALAAIRTFGGRPVVLILGGDDKGLDYTALYQEIEKSVSHAVVLGPGLGRMADELRERGFPAVGRAETMREAVRQAASRAEHGGVVLLSPASSSFDLFKDYKDRGRAFKDAVRSL